MKFKDGKGWMGPADTNNPYRQLAFAIVHQAVDDYEDYCRYEARGAFSPKEIRDAKKFLLSPMPEYYTGIPGKYLKRHVDELLRKERERVRKLLYL